MRSESPAWRIFIFSVLLLGVAGVGAWANFNIQIDYRFDEDTLNGGLNFFDPNTTDGLMARNTLEAAAAELESWLNDPLGAITPGGGDTYQAYFFDPTDSGSATRTVTNLAVPASSVTVFAGAFTGGLSTLLGQGGKGSYLNLSGSTPFRDSVLTRGGEAPTVMWGGMIRFKVDRSNWHLDAASLPSTGEYDFYTVALHELVHVLGVGQCSCWDTLRNSLEFAGDFSTQVYNENDADTLNPDNPVPLGDSDHWDNTVTSVVASDPLSPQEVLMGPNLSTGVRLELTRLDLAGLADIDWEVTGINAIPEPAAAGVVLGLACFWLLRRRGRRGSS